MNCLRMPSFVTDLSPGSKEAILEGFRRTKCQSWRGIDNVSRGGWFIKNAPFYVLPKIDAEIANAIVMLNVICFMLYILLMRINWLINRFLSDCLKRGGNEFAAMRISVLCVAMLSNSSFTQQKTRSFSAKNKIRIYLFPYSFAWMIELKYICIMSSTPWN